MEGVEEEQVRQLCGGLVCGLLRTEEEWSEGERAGGVEIKFFRHGFSAAESISTGIIRVSGHTKINDLWISLLRYRYGSPLKDIEHHSFHVGILFCFTSLSTQSLNSPRSL